MAHWVNAAEVTGLRQDDARNPAVSPIDDSNSIKIWKMPQDLKTETTTSLSYALTIGSAQEKI